MFAGNRRFKSKFQESHQDSVLILFATCWSANVFHHTRQDFE